MAMATITPRSNFINSLRRSPSPTTNYDKHQVTARITTSSMGGRQRYPPPPHGTQKKIDFQRGLLRRSRICPEYQRLPTSGDKNPPPQHQKRRRYHHHPGEISSGPSHVSKRHNQKETRYPRRETHHTGAAMQTFMTSGTDLCTRGHERVKKL